MRKSIRKLSLRRYHQGVNSLDLPLREKNLKFDGSSFSEVMLLMNAYILCREILMESTYENPQTVPVVRHDYTFDTYPCNFWSNFKVSK